MRLAVGPSYNKQRQAHLATVLDHHLVFGEGTLRKQAPTCGGATPTLTSRLNSICVAGAAINLIFVCTAPRGTLT